MGLRRWRNRLHGYRVTRDLPEALELPLRSGAPWWYWLGGRPALDLCNTLRERWRRRVETLVTPADLDAWLGEGGLRDGPPTAGARLLEETRALREAIDAGVVAAVAGEAPPRAAVELIDAWLARAAPRPRLRPGEGGAVLAHIGPDDPTEAALGRVALDAAAALGTAERGRLRICAPATCSARFYDRSPAARRRWCSMAGCGNRAKVRAHRRRARREE